MNVYSVDKNVFKSKPFRRFDRYICRDLEISQREKMRLFHSRAESTVKLYTKVIKNYVRFSKSENFPAFPVTEKSVRQFIDNLELKKHKSMFYLIKPSLIFCKNVRGDPEISFNTTDLVLEGLLREVGNNFRKKPTLHVTSELDVRKFLLRCLYGQRMCAPYSTNMIEFRTGIRNLICLYCLGRCADYMLLRKQDIQFEEDMVVVTWSKRKNNQRGDRQLSLVPKLQDHPLDLYEALKHYFEFTKMNDDQMLNTRLNSKGKAVSNVGIARSKCYEDNNKICRQLKLPKISEKMCKSIGTR